MNADPYPENLSEIPDEALGFAPLDPKVIHASEPVDMRDPTVVALNRIAVAVEQLVLATLDKPHPLNAHQPFVTPQNAPLAALPPVVAPTANAGVCPIHGTPWKIVPAGVSKKTGKPYDAFAACSTAGCDQRPPR